MGVVVATTLSVLNARSASQTAVTAGTGVVSGRVIDATTRQPVVAANVGIGSVPEGPTTFPIQDCCGVNFVLNMGGDFGRTTTTDAEGRFTFANLPARTFELSAYGGRSLGGWAWWGQTSPDDGAKWIQLSDGQRIDGLQIALPRMAVVGGRVLDERGEPVGGIGILVTPADWAGAVPRYSGQAATTDDRGRFSAATYPGEHFVSTAAYPAVASTLASRPGSAFPRVFFPQANSVGSAARITLAPGDERSDIDFVVSPQRVFRISGPSEGAANLALELFAADERRPGAAPLARGNAVQGRFSFASVPPGRYVLHALAGPEMPYMSHGTAALRELPASSTMWTESAVTVVDRDVDVRLNLKPGVRISGRVEFDGVLPRPSLADLVNRTLIVERADGSDSDYRGAYVTGDRFSSIQIEPGRYIVRPNPPEKWRLKSVMAGGRDISDYPVDLAQTDVNDAVITFTDRRSAIAGRLIRQGPDDLMRGWITVFPTDRAYWPEYGIYPRRIAFIECGRSGVFEAEVPPGSYYVAATRWVTRGRLSVAQLSSLAASATAIVVGDNQTVQVDVRFPRAK